ncbi:DUF805 domain-containing protein [Piscinibacter terrae]|uniref:DUF805 domain-containing protein n=1 Tax=Piscinibacter terrae TaxID=2496871 RepID=A0A3N7HM28_9BURK|nr:DUF805 domain-containing protein [Albitalea terrae]RQP21671.1 DUF805 domain-containing protein [Albitalea terrae]
MDASVQIVFFGEVMEGFHLDDVKRKVGQLLKLDEPRVAQMFSGTRTVLKRAVPPADAKRYADVLAKVGARIHIEPTAAPAKPAAAPVKPAAAAPASKAGGIGFPSIQMPDDEPAPRAGSGDAPRPAPIPAAVAKVPATSAKTLELAPLTEAAVDEVTCPNCGERQTKRLLCRGCSTNIEMAIANLAERENAAREAKKDELLARQAMRASRSSIRSSSPGVFGFSLSGRMGRLKYATAHAWMWALLLLLVVPVIEKPTIGRILFFLLGLALVAFMSMRHSVLRCHDCDKSGWWTMLTFVPGASVILSLVLSFAPGTNGDNDYGEQPPSQPWAFLGIAVVVLVIGFALMIKASIHSVQMRGMHETEEMSESEKEAFDPRANTLLSTPEQRDNFNGPYMAARENKAFAVSSAGGWGMATSAGSVNEAARAAVADCDTRRPAYTPQCTVVNVNGQWYSSRRR